MIAHMLVLSAVASLVQDPSATVDAAALVEHVRESEQWIHGVDSFHARFEGEWTRSAESIAQRRAELDKQFPNITEEQLQQFSDLKPQTDDELVIAFDQRRLYRYVHRVGSGQETQIWNGGYVLHIGGAPADPDLYRLDDDLEQGMGEYFLSFPSWPRASSHSFWWHAGYGPDSEWGAARYFKIIDRRDYQGIDCYVLEGKGGFATWFVGADSGLLHGFIQRALLPENDAIEVIKALAEKHDYEWVSNREWYQWRATLPRETREQLSQDYHAALIDQTRPFDEHVLLDYRDLGDGRMFPFRQGRRLFEEEPGEDGEYEVRMERELRAVEVTIDEPLPDELFEHTMKEGVRTEDYRHDVPITYLHAADMSQEQIDELLEKQRAIFDRQQAEQQAEKNARDELIGQPAFPFPENTTWLNGGPLKWDDLKGKVVILDFFADWCGPCRRDYPRLAELHRHRERNQLTIIGIHTPGSDLDSIKTLLAQFDLKYPVVIDTAPPEGTRAWGLLYSQYRILGIPHAVAVDKDGRIAGHGYLHEVYGIAFSLVHAEGD